MFRFRSGFPSLVIAASLLCACGSGTPPQNSPSKTVAPAPTIAITMAVPTITAPQATSTAEVLPEEPRAMTMERFDFTGQALAANLLGDPATRHIYVLLPPGYATSSKRYPVVYVLQGYGVDSSVMVSPFQIAFQQARKAGPVQDMIMVFPDGKNKLGGSFYLNSPTTGGHETYISQELVNYIDTHFRTLPKRESRGITGCSMGGAGAVHLGLSHPDIFSVVAPVSSSYNWGEPGWKEFGTGLKEAPKDLAAFPLLPWGVQVGIAMAAAAAPNPDNPPFYLDLPWTVSGSDVEAVESVVQRIANADPMHDAMRYAEQPQRLAAFMLYHGKSDTTVPVEEARAYDKLLTDLGIEHSVVEVDNGGHCTLDYTPIVQFMSEHLASQKSTD